MTTFKCKMCGGELQIRPGETVAVCEYCGSKQTLPKTSDEYLGNLFNRANNLRLKCEFDKAEQIYEKIVQQDDSEAEAHWGLVLCKYGIEYVEDPKTKKRIPTCHRTLYEAITADPDYQAAIDYSDASQQAIYENEARAIDRLQRDILAIVKNKKPFDVFICYKETDENGKRTVDSAIANDIYYQLTQEGFKVFYAAITLEDKLGQEYEPYIFAALNSAKVMLAIGTKPEYFNAVWVKNEWSRYLNLMKMDRSKLLIPCYRDMDAYDLPEEFAHLQAQDMSKIGFINDVVRGIKKVIMVDEPKAIAKEPVVVNSGTNVTSLLERAFLFLEDGNWDEADAYCEKVLDQEPKNAEAYLGKLMAELHVRRQEELPNMDQPFDGNNNFQKAVRFGGEKMAAMLNDYVAGIKERNEQNRLTGVYHNALDLMRSAKDESGYKNAAQIFKQIPGFQDADILAEQCLEKAAEINERNEQNRLAGIYDNALGILRSAEDEFGYQNAAQIFKQIPGFKDADALAEQCLEKAEVCRKDSIYNSARSKMIRETVSRYEAAINAFRSIPGWKDADEQIAVCQSKIEEINAKVEADRLEAARKAEERRIAKEKASKKRKKIAAIVIPIVLVIAAGLIVLFTVVLPEARKNSDYNSAIALYNEGKYEEAKAAFVEMDGYKDSYEQVSKCDEGIRESKYESAVSLLSEEKYAEAIAILGELKGYKDSSDLLSKYTAKYNEERLKKVQIGDVVTFGPHQWIVLAREGSNAMLITKDAIAKMPYNQTYVDVTWETCTLRSWLNSSFLNNFSASDQAKILTTTVSNPKNTDYGTAGGNTTNDKVFLLSISEVRSLFGSNTARVCYYQGSTCWWWLRSPGHSGHYAAIVILGGYVDSVGDIVNYAYLGVRPALWINLESLISESR